MEQVAIKHRCHFRNALYLSNGVVLDSVSFDNSNGQVQNEVAVIKVNPESRNPITDKCYIIGIASKQIIGYIGTNWIPTYVNNTQSSQPKDDSLNYDGSTLHSVVMGNSKDNLMTAQTPPPAPHTPPSPPADIKLPIMPGFEFKPVATEYSRVKDVVFNGFIQWKILIGVTEMDAAKHNGVYTSLSTKAKNRSNFKVAVRDDVLLPLDSRKDAAAFYMIANKNADVTISTGIKTHGFFTSTTSILNSGINVSNLTADTMYVEDKNSIIVNKLHTIALTYHTGMTFMEWIEAVNMSLTSVEKSAISNWVFDVIDDYLTSIDNEYSLDRYTFDLWGNGLKLEDHIIKTVTDITTRELYLEALLLVVKRLTNQTSCQNYLHLSDIVSDSDFNIRDSIVTGGGISEHIPVVISNNDDIDLELSMLRQSTDTDWRLLSTNTPNTTKLIKALFTGNDLDVLNGVYDIKNGNLSIDLIYFMTANHILKVLKNESGKYLITIVV